MQFGVCHEQMKREKHEPGLIRSQAMATVQSDIFKPTKFGGKYTVALIPGTDAFPMAFGFTLWPDHCSSTDTKRIR